MIGSEIINELDMLQIQGNISELKFGRSIVIKRFVKNDDVLWQLTRKFNPSSIFDDKMYYNVKDTYLYFDEQRSDKDYASFLTTDLIELIRVARLMEIEERDYKTAYEPKKWHSPFLSPEIVSFWMKKENM